MTLWIDYEVSKLSQAQSLSCGLAFIIVDSSLLLLSHSVISLSVPPVCGSDISSQLLFYHYACLPAAMFPSLMVIYTALEMISKP